MKSRTVTWNGHETRVGDVQVHVEFLSENGIKRPLVSRKRRWKDNIEMDRRVMQLTVHRGSCCNCIPCSVGLPATGRGIDLLWCMARDPGGLQSIHLEHWRHFLPAVTHVILVPADNTT
jgi:hypothetical protein